MLGNLTLNSICLLFFGLLVIIAGGCVTYIWRMYPLAAGMVFTGIGIFLGGMTNGFADYSPRGRLFWKLGVLALAMGLPLIGWSLYRL